MKKSIYELSVKVRNETASKEEMINFIERSIKNTLPSFEKCTIDDLKKLAYFITYANEVLD